MKIKLFLRKSIEQNAALYYEKAKKAKRKIEGANNVLGKFKKKLFELEAKKASDIEEIEKKASAPKKKRKQQWFEKFRWFYSSEGFLCVGGRDATTNEIIVKKHTDKHDLVFHTKVEGSPFFVIKTEGKKLGKLTLEETAYAAVSYSKAWKLGLAGADTFYVNPDQLSRQAPSGEYLEKGSFMVNGKMNFVYGIVELAIGIKEGQIIGGPVSAIKKHAEKFVVIIQGKERTSAVAKKIQHKIGGDLDDIIRFIPAGGAKIKN